MFLYTEGTSCYFTYKTSNYNLISFQFWIKTEKWMAQILFKQNIMLSTLTMLERALLCYFQMCWSSKILNTIFCMLPTGHQNEPTGASAEAVYVWNLSHTCCRQTASHCCVLLPYDTLQNWDDSTTSHICHKDNLSQPFAPARYEKLKWNGIIQYTTKALWHLYN